jgi:hypothetical protein
VDKPAFAVLTLAVVADGHLVDFDGLSNTQQHIAAYRRIQLD